MIINRKKTALILSAIAVIMILMTGCGTDDIDISGYKDAEIVFSGIEDKDVVLTIDDLKSMDCITKKTESTSDKIGVVRATGPKLDTVLENYNLSQADFSKIVIYGEDKYDVKLLNDYLKEHDIILAIGIDGEPLNMESAPCRIIIPKSDSAYWVRMVNRIEFIK